MAQLTGQERVERMLRREDHDRVPRYDSFWPETVARWESEGLTGGRDGALDLLQADACQIGWFELAPFPGREEVVREEGDTRIVRNAFGALLREWRDRSGTPEHVGFGCDSRAEWEGVYRPALLSHTVQLDIGAYRHELARVRSQQRWAMFGTIESYEFLKRLIGDEVALVAMLQEPEWVADMSRTYTDAALANFAALLAEGVRPDGVFLSADMAYNHGPMFSPDTYRALLRDDAERMIRWFHERGIAVWWHGDGNVNELVGDYVDMGIDMLHPLEAAADMDLARLMPTYGDRLSFWGNQDKRIWATNDPTRIEAHVVDRLRVGMEKRGYGFHSDHSVQPEVSLDTYCFILDLVDRHGRYA